MKQSDNDTGWRKGVDGIWTIYTRIIQAPYRVMIVSEYGWRDWRWSVFYGSSEIGKGKVTGSKLARDAALRCALETI